MGAVLNLNLGTYFDELKIAMGLLSTYPNSIFVGQGVACAGTTMTDTLVNVPRDKLLEFPVAEDMQMGFAIGLALNGYLPICIYPRWNFLLLAANQLVNHLDRLPIYSAGRYTPKVIIRTSAPSVAPFNPGPQHDDDFTDAFRLMLRTVTVVRLERADQIIPSYCQAAERPLSTLLVEHTALYGDRVPSGMSKPVPA